MGQEYSAIAGFLRQYPIHYVVADERGVVRLRTNYRGEHVWLYRVKPLRPEGARALLLDYAASINALAERPAWYNALTDNCTTSIQRHARHLNPAGNPFDWRLLANGHMPELLYEQGRIETSLPFEELQRRSHIDARAKAADQDPAFSARIRETAPGAVADFHLCVLLPTTPSRRPGALAPRNLGDRVARDPASPARGDTACRVGARK